MNDLTTTAADFYIEFDTVLFRYCTRLSFVDESTMLVILKRLKTILVNKTASLSEESAEFLLFSFIPLIPNLRICCEGLTPSGKRMKQFQKDFLGGMVSDFEAWVCERMITGILAS